MVLSSVHLLREINPPDKLALRWVRSLWSVPVTSGGKPMPTKSKKSSNSEGLMSDLLLLAEADFKDDRRSEKRYPFFRAASVQMDNRSFSAFTREISASGLGLLH